MFGRKKDTTPKTPEGIEPLDRDKMRNLVFETLSKRVGEAGAAVMRADFDGHIEEDPLDGVEVAYLCLLGKLVDVVDRLNEMSYSTQQDAPISPFLTFRKDG